MKTRSSSYNSPAGDRKSTIEVRVNRRSKRIKNENPVADSIPVGNNNINKKKKRFNRSALVEKEDPGQFGAPTRKTLKLRVGSGRPGRHGRSLINLRSVLETGWLEGVRVSYDFDVEGKNLQGIIKGAGILCSCSLCVGTKVIPPSQFELHACKQYRHAIKHIRLENGKSLLEVIETCKASDSVEAALQTVISSLPVKGPSVCTKCNGSIEASSTENLLVCDSCVNKKQVEVKSGVATRTLVRYPVEVALQTVNSSLPVKGPSLCTKCNGLVEASSNKKLLVCDSCVRKMKVEAKPSVVARGQVRVSSSDNKRKRGRPRKASSPDPTAFESNTPLISVDNKKRRGRPKKSSVSALKPVTSPEKFKVSGKKRNSKVIKRSPTSASAPRSMKSATECTSSEQKSGIKNQQFHSLVFQESGLRERAKLTYIVRGKKVLVGYKSGTGISCSCCDTVLSPSQFEAHAGWASRKKPYEHIYLSNGKSLHEYAVSLKKKENRTRPVKNNNDVCRVCKKGGDLLLCDTCPRTFHRECAREPSIPLGKWQCKYCQRSSKVNNKTANSLAAQRARGDDSAEQFNARGSGMKPVENIVLGACVLCRCHEFSKRGFNDQTVIVCDQCEKEHHIGCLRKHKMANLKKLPKGDWFCRNDCKRINSLLKNLLNREPETLSDDMLTSWTEKQMKNNNSESDSNLEIKFVLLRGKSAARESKKLLAQTVKIFHEGFDPIIDSTSGRDFIPSMVYGRKIWSQDFAGMLCAMLTIDSKVVTAGTLRVFDEDVAELPIVATRKSNQGKGYFQLLFTCIEKVLSSLKIKNIVLPAADDARSMWTQKFGFELIAPEQLNELRQSCPAIMTFQGTSLLKKELEKAA